MEFGGAQRRQWGRRAAQWRTAAIGIGALMVAVAASQSAARMILATVALRREVQELTEKQRALAEQERELRRELSVFYYPETLERKGKERFNLKRTGEEVIVVPPANSRADTRSRPESSWWRRALWFFLP